MTCWKIEVAEGIVWLELSWQIFIVLCLESNNLCLEKKYTEYYEIGKGKESHYVD